MPNDFKIVGRPTWRNTLHNDTSEFGHISELAGVATTLSYPYILWNDRVYAIHVDDSGHTRERDTGLTVEEVL